ncbi:MAG: hypothetical protein V4726_00655 [Verrucomicrobiota bacterium]
MKLKPFLQLSALALPLLLSATPVPAQNATAKTTAQVQKDPFVKTETAPAPVARIVIAGASEQETVPEALARMEWVSLTPADARHALRKFPRQADLYQWVQDELDKPDKSAVTLERLEVLRLRSGQRSKVEAIDEQPYATEFQPGQVPQSVGLGVPAAVVDSSTTTHTITPPAPSPSPAPKPAGAKGETGPAGEAALPSLPVSGIPADFLKVPITPQSLEFKNTGWTVEMELTLSEDRRTADINIAPEHIKLMGHVAIDSEKQIFQPVFEASKLATQVAARVGQPALVGTMSPPIDSGVPSGNKEHRVWFMFLTVNLPE